MDLNQITKNLRTISLNETQDNLMCSRDSINAIPPSDIEQLETDVEDNINHISVPFSEQSYQNDNAKTIKNNMKPIDFTPAPVVSSQTCFVSGNNNMILNHLNDNFAINEATKSTASASNKNKAATCNSTLKKSRNKDLEKRKLSQNLDNFSLRLGHNVENDNTKKSSDKVALSKKEQENKLKDSKTNTMKNSNQSGEDKQSTE